MTDRPPVAALPPDASDDQIRAALTAMVLADDYPCVGARSVFRRGTAEVAVFEGLADPATAPELQRRLAAFGSHADSTVLASFVAVFRGPAIESEEQFERLLWRQLADLAALDDSPWDPRVDPDPTSPKFGFSIGGEGFFVVGMHPRASRLARRAPLPVLVFNLHRQFDHLRATGRFDRIRDTIRRRDTRFQGAPNPMVADHGSITEARQYSGRAVPRDWRPPVHLTATKEHP